MSIAIKVRKVQRNLSDYGILETCKKILFSLTEMLYLRRKYRLYRRDLALFQDPEASSGGPVLRIIGRDDHEAINQIENMEEWLQGMLKDELSHALCVAAFDKDRVIGFNLIALNEVFVPFLNIKKRLRPDQAWSEQITVLKEYRKQGLASALRYRVFTELKKRGIRKLYGGALVSNVASLKSARKVGFHFIVDVEYCRVLKRENWTYRRIDRAEA